MIIPIIFSPLSDVPKLPPALAKISHDEVVLIELQGSLEVDSTQEREKAGKLVGTLKIDEATNRPALQIGHHLLEGKIDNLAKPLAVLHRASSSGRPSKVSESRRTRCLGSRRVDGSEGGGDDKMDCDDDHGEIEEDGNDDLGDRSREDVGLEGGEKVVWNAVAIVRRKIVFSKRPMLVVGRSSGKVE